MFVVADNATTTPDKDVKFVIRARICSLVIGGLEVHAVAIVDPTSFFVSETLFWGEVFLRRTISTRVLPLLKRIQIQAHKNIFINYENENKITIHSFKK